MPKMATYRLDRYDGGLSQQPEPSDEGMLRLSDTHWILTFTDQDVGVSGGLLRSELSVEAVDRRRSVLRLTSEGSGSCSMVLLAPAQKVKEVVTLRMANLARTCNAVDGVADGQWWRDSRVFAELGPLHATSIGGVRYEGGWWKDDRVRPNRRRAVLDFGPEGVVLRKWRRKLALPWALVDSLEIIDGPSTNSSRANIDDTLEPKLAGSGQGTTIIVRSPSGRTARFSTPTMTPDSIRIRLSPITERLEDVGGHPPSAA